MAAPVFVCLGGRVMQRQSVDEVCACECVCMCACKSNLILSLYTIRHLYVCVVEQ